MTQKRFHGNHLFSRTPSFLMESQPAGIFLTSELRLVQVGIPLQMEAPWCNTNSRVSYLSIVEVWQRYIFANPEYLLMPMFSVVVFTCLGQGKSTVLGNIFYIKNIPVLKSEKHVSCGGWQVLYLSICRFFQSNRILLVKFTICVRLESFILIEHT